MSREPMGPMQRMATANGTATVPVCDRCGRAGPVDNFEIPEKE
jgi:hypothetical protein